MNILHICDIFKAKIFTNRESIITILFSFSNQDLELFETCKIMLIHPSRSTEDYNVFWFNNLI